MPATTDRPVARLLLMSTVLPLALAVGAAVLVWSWRDDLPDPVARHWGADGADGFSSLPTVMAMVVGLGVLFAAIGGVLALAAHDRSTARAAIGFSSGTAAFVVVLATASTGVQRGLGDAADSQFPGGWLLVALVAGALVGIGTAALVPSWTSTTPDKADAATVDPVSLAVDERAAWSRAVGSDAVGIVIAVAGLLVVVVVAIVTEQWWTLAIAAPILLLVIVMASVRVSVDRRGVTVRSRIGWPRFHTDIADIAKADVVRVNALRDFGGYGIRLAMVGQHKGTRGVVLRSGEALRLTRVDGGRELVVVDNATTAAGLVNGLLHRAAR